jgi:dimethylamine/trimethylamine dehydrogenase
MLYSSMEIPVGQLDHPQVFTPDDIAAGRLPEGPTLLFDFDNYYMGGVLTEHLASQGISITYATPAGHASAWTIMTNELPLVHRALAKRRIPVITLHLLSAFDGETATLKHLFTGEEASLTCRSVVIVGLRAPRGELVAALEDRAADVAGAGVRSIERAGDALAPGAIVHAVHSGHRVAREIDLGERPASYRRDFPIVGTAKAGDSIGEYA